MPAGIDFYSEMEEGLLEALFAWTREASAGIDDLGLKTLVGEIFEARGEETHRAYDVHFGERSAIRGLCQPSIAAEIFTPVDVQADGRTRSGV